MNARDAANMALSSYREKGESIEEWFRAVDNEAFSEPRDVPLAMQLAKGVLQNRMLCDFYIAHFSARPIASIDPLLLDIMRISTYQLAFLSKIPRSAAVNESVKLASSIAGSRSAGFANAVLRKIAEASRNGSLPELKSKGVKRLSVLYSHPEMLVRKFREELDLESLEKFLASNNAPGIPVTAQINALITDTDSVLESLRADNIECYPHEYLSDCIQIKNMGNIARIKEFAKGGFYIQDAAARMAVIAADPASGDLVIDGCAAPGGKSFAAAIMMKDKGKIISYDANNDKLRLVAEGAKRLMASSIETVAEIPREAAGKADVVIADVPCSGYGVIRRKPDIRYKDPKAVHSLGIIQRQILKNLSDYVRPGGVLLYSTCTVLRNENKDVIVDFLESCRDFSAEGFELPGGIAAPGGMATLWPHIHGTDGFFICKMRKKHE